MNGTNKPNSIDQNALTLEIARLARPVERAEYFEVSQVDGPPGLSNPSKMKNVRNDHVFPSHYSL